MTVAASSALNVTGTDTDADQYTTASWSPTVGKGYLVAFARLDLGASVGSSASISGNNISWSSVAQVGSTATQPFLAVWYGFADGAATAGSLTFSDIVEASQTADGAIWGIVELENVGPGSIVQSDTATTSADSISVTLGAFADAANATGAWVLSYNDGGTAGTGITAGSGFSIVTNLDANQEMGGDGVRIVFEFREDNDTSVNATAVSTNDRMHMVAFEIKDVSPIAAVSGPSVTVTAGAATVALDTGEQYVAPSGPSVSVTAGAPALDLTVIVSGPSVVVSAGAVTVVPPGQSVEDVAGPSVTVTAGTATVVLQGVIVTGPSVVVSAGAATVTSSQPVEVSGPSVTVTAGSAEIDLPVVLTGPSVSVSAGAPALDLAVVVSGPTVTVTPGTVTVAPAGLQVEPVGVTVTVSAGAPLVTAQIVHDAVSSSGGTFTGDTSWTHTPADTPKGVLVLIGGGQEADGPDVSAITYGGVALTKIDFYARNEIWFLGESVPAGAQTVQITTTAATYTKTAICVTVTTPFPKTQITDGPQRASGDSATPTLDLNDGGAASRSYGVAKILDGATSAISTTDTEILEVDLGSVVVSFARGGAVQLDWANATSVPRDSIYALGVAVAPLAAQAQAVEPSGPTVTVTAGMASASGSVLVTAPTVMVTAGVGFVTSATIAADGATVTVTPGVALVTWNQELELTAPTITVTAGTTDLYTGVLTAGATVTVTAGTGTVVAVRIRRTLSFTSDEYLDLQVVPRRVETFQFDVQDAAGNTLGTLAVTGTPKISNDHSRRIKRDLTGVTIPPRTDQTSALDQMFFAADLDVARHRIKVWHHIEHPRGTYTLPLGVFMFSSDPRRVRTYGNTIDATLDDLSHVFDQPAIETVTWAAGTNVRTALLELYADLGLTCDVDPTTVTLGEPLTMLALQDSPQSTAERLCNLAGFLPPYFTNDGTGRCRATPDFSNTTPTLQYGTGSRAFDDTIIDASALLLAPNIWIAEASSATDQPITGRWALPATDPHSYEQIGFWIPEKVDVQGIDTATAAEEAARAAGQASRKQLRRRTWTSPVDSRHDTFDPIGWDDEILLEQSWSMDLTPGGTMTHEAVVLT